MAVLHNSIFENVDLSLPLMVLSESWKKIGNDHFSALLSAIAIEYSREISEAHLPKSLDSKDAEILAKNLAMHVNFFSDLRPS
jgi:hypothetical protein